MSLTVAGTAVVVAVLLSNTSQQQHKMAHLETEVSVIVVQQNL